MREKLAGRYELVRELGAGAMGRVYLATDVTNGHRVAVKVLAAGGDADLSALLRFQQEGAVLSTLKHPNIVEVYGTFLDGDTSCIVMEFLEGGPLRRLLDAERIPLPRTKNLARQVAAALAYAHGRGIIHRDVKPDNIMVIGNDHVKVTDFGVARVLLEGATLATRTGMSIGTPLYMAPEQIEGQKVDGRADIYSLGAVLYQMVTGRPPFEGDDPLTVAFKHVHRAPEPPRQVNADVPADWEELILRALAKDPAQRFQSAGAMEEAIDALRPADSRTMAPSRPDHVEPARKQPGVESAPTVSGLQADQPLPAFPPGGTVTFPGPALQQPAAPPAEPVGKQGVPALVWALAGALLLVLVAGGAFLVLSRHSSSSPPNRAGTATDLRTPAAVWGQTGSQPGQFRSPAGLATDGQSNVYVADAGNNRIQKLASTSDPINTWGTQGSEPGQLADPESVAVDSQGTVYVADTSNNRIDKFSSDGKLQDVWGSQGSGQGQLDRPLGVAVDGDGNIYVADSANNRVQKLSPSGSVLGTWGSQGSSAGRFSHPSGVAVDGSGNVYVADTGNNRIQKLDPSGSPLAQWSGFQGPDGVALDQNGRIYVADTGNNRVVELSSQGHVLTAWGGQGTRNGRFSGPRGVAVDAQGNTYVADTGNDRLQEFGPLE